MFQNTIVYIHEYCNIQQLNEKFASEYIHSKLIKQFFIFYLDILTNFIKDDKIFSVNYFSYVIVPKRSFSRQNSISINIIILRT